MQNSVKIALAGLGALLLVGFSAGKKYIKGASGISIDPVDAGGLKITWKKPLDNFDPNILTSDNWDSETLRNAFDKFEFWVRLRLTNPTTNTYLAHLNYIEIKEQNTVIGTATATQNRIELNPGQSIVSKVNISFDATKLFDTPLELKGKSLVIHLTVHGIKFTEIVDLSNLKF